jgi:hypothetical protein
LFFNFILLQCFLQCLVEMKLDVFV